MDALQAFLTSRRMTQDQFGALVGVSGVTVHRWLRHKARPSWVNIAQIERVTSGAVSAQDFVPPVRSV